MGQEIIGGRNNAISGCFKYNILIFGRGSLLDNNHNSCHLNFFVNSMKSRNPAAKFYEYYECEQPRILRSTSHTFKRQKYNFYHEI